MPTIAFSSPRLSAFVLLLATGTALSTPSLAATAEATVEAAEAHQVSGVEVTAAPAYTTKASDSSAKLPLTLRETPQSVTVVTRQRIDDFNLVSIADVLVQTAGVTVQENDSNRVNFTSRGFSITNFQLDGVPTSYTSGNSVMGDTFLYDRVEVVRGATGLVTGSGDPSATINLLRKSPTETFQAQAGATVGSWNNYRVEGDVSGPLWGDGRVRGRLVGAYGQKDSYIAFYSEEKLVGSATLEADVTSNLTVRVGYDYQRVTPEGTTWGTAPLYYRDGTPTSLDRSYNVAAKWSTWDRNSQSLFAVLDWKIAEDWNFKAAVNHRENNSTALLYYGYGGYPDRVTGAGLTVADYYNIYEEEELGFDLYLTGAFNLFGRKHELVLGANGYNRDGTTVNTAILSRPYAMTIPNFRTWTGDIPEPVRVNYGTPASIERTDETGLYGALRLNPMDGLKVIVGARRSDYDKQVDNYNLQGVYTRTTGRMSDSHTSPYLGVIYDVTANISAYASYSDLFKVQSNKNKNNEQLDPVTGANYEAGLKGEFLNDRLLLAASYFHVKQDNLAELDPTVPNGFILPDGSSAYRAVSGAVTRGFDVEANGQLAENWRVSAGYTYAYTENAAGLRISTLNPRNLMRVYSTYDIKGGILDRLTVGGGVNWQSEIFTAATIPTSNTTTVRTDVKQKAYALVNLMARYPLTEQVSLSLNVDNLFDKVYYRRVGFYNGGYFGEPRKVTATVRAKF